MEWCRSGHNGADSKSVGGANLAGVRIPLTPPKNNKNTIKNHYACIVVFGSEGNVSTSDLVEYTNRSKPTVLKMLKEFEEKDLIEWVGTNEFDPQKKYRLK